MFYHFMEAKHAPAVSKHTIGTKHYSRKTEHDNVFLFLDLIVFSGGTVAWLQWLKDGQTNAYTNMEDIKGRRIRQVFQVLVKI